MLFTNVVGLLTLVTGTLACDQIWVQVHDQGVYRRVTAWIKDDKYNAKIWGSTHQGGAGQSGFTFKSSAAKLTYTTKGDKAVYYRKGFSSTYFLHRTKHSQCSSPDGPSCSIDEYYHANNC